MTTPQVRCKLEKDSMHRVALCLCLLLLPARIGWSYSLLTHEELVDILWQDQLQPLLLARYPGATADQLRRAHAYAYGGSLIQDIGYYPFGNKLFSELTHYVRSGDFIANLIRESADVDQYAFALGALIHYASDNRGHPSVNHAVALSFRKLRRKYGERVTYEQDPKAHIQTEFGFDITQVAKHRYTSDRYHDFIGFEVSRPVLERSFLKTYGLPMQEVMGLETLAIGTFRHSVSQIIPEMTRAALTAYHPELVSEIPNFSERHFLYNLSRVQYQTEWGKEYREPGLIARLLGLLVRRVPKVWFLKALAFKLPTPETEDLCIKSVNGTVEHSHQLLREVGNGNLQFPNTDCDTGQPTRPGEYALTDKSYAQLLDRLVRQGAEVPEDLRLNILSFYAAAAPPQRTRKQRKAWQRTAEELKLIQLQPRSAEAQALRRRLLAPPFKVESPKAKDQ